MSSPDVNITTRLSRLILTIGFAIGLVLSLSVLSGDDSGRVNLLYLLIVFLFIPVIGAALSIISLVGDKGLNLARLISWLPLWSKAQQAFLHKIRQQHMDKQWFFLQSQAAALAYSTASLLVFLILLVATDINFVWRSTLLSAEQLLPLLSLIAMPWFFWDLAQPSLELLQATQDSRLTQVYADKTGFGQWWAFVFATQLIYSFLLRGVLLILAKLWVQRRFENDLEQQLSNNNNNNQAVQVEQHSLASITPGLPESYALNNWAQLSPKALSELSLRPDEELPQDQLDNPTYSGQQLILVKAWEPPMGELQDYMQEGQGLVFPVNYKQATLIPPETTHLEEWQRFVKRVPAWRIYQPEQWITEDES